MTAVKTKLVNEKNIVIILTVTVLILVALVINANGKLRSVLLNNDTIVSDLAKLNLKVSEMGQKTLDAISKVAEQRSEIEELRKRLTQERLKNVQLQGELEKLGISPAVKSVAVEAPAAAQTPSI
jgi:cell shape-determining protein MreC